MEANTQATVATNAAWFQNNDDYIKNQSQLEFYRLAQRMVEREVRGENRVLDIGNGGFFNYDTALAKHVTAVDLFVPDGPGPTPNSTFKQGSFLALPFADGTFDCAIQQNVLHHVTGRSVSENFANMRQCLREMYRVLAPGGKAVLIESTVGPWFNLFERLVYRPVLWIKRGGHPVTFQYTARQLRDAGTACGFDTEEFAWIPLGRWVLLMGVVWPTILTPIKPVKLVFRKLSAVGGRG
jgi:SAM-dependent methyltransferase